MSITYRMAGEEDAAALAAVFHECFRETFGHLYDPADLATFIAQDTLETWVAKLRDPGFAIRVAEERGEIVGFVKLGPLQLPTEPSAPPLELRQLYILKPWHGTGIAAELMDWFMAEARARKAQELYLSVFTDNHRARRFYARYGFVDVAPYAFMVGNHADEDIIMRCSL
jgi:ribosomal protein S18 acetylase RimI-like enzyme